MSEDLHAKAQELLNRSAVEGLQPGEDAWLRSHLTECVECARGAAAMQEGLRALHSVPVLVPKDLTARTQSRVRLRAREISTAASGSFWLWMVAAASWLLGVFSAPLVWKMFAWAGGSFGVPKLAMEMGFVIWWTVPALVAVSVVLHRRVVATGAKGI
jgi:hypothetical protein